MFSLKKLLVDNFETVVVFILVAAVAFLVFLAVNKIAFLNFFYIPTLVASYYLGKKKGILVGILVVTLVAFYALLDPNLFVMGEAGLPVWNLTLWGSFLVITAYVVGNLYEKKESALDDLKEAYEGVLEILLKFIDSIDRYTEEHSVRVSSLAVEVARSLGLQETEVEDIRVAGLLHDIGKLEVSVDVLKKATSLTDEEWEEMKKHTSRATNIMRPVGGLLKEVVPLVLTHHEFYNGGGYGHLKYSEIPLGSRILAVVDAYDSMISDRPYRAGRTPWEALLEIESHSGKQFDPEVVKVFNKVVKSSIQKH